MSKSGICNKVKHIKNISKIRDRVVSDLIADGLLIEGSWFASKRANGSTSLQFGYLKGFPKDDLEDQGNFLIC